MNNLLNIYTFISSKLVLLADNDCGILGNPAKEGDFAWYLKQFYYIIEYAGAAMCIGLIIFDIFKYITQQDDKGTDSLIKRTITRIGVAVLLFLLPVFLNAILSALSILGFKQVCLF